MITAYLKQNEHITAQPITASNVSSLDHAIWIDLLNPTKDEEHLVEKHLKLQIPSKEEMQELILSSRLYSENHILYMTATMLANSASTEPRNDAVTFILTKTHLITVRYVDLQAFSLFVSEYSRLEIMEFTPENFLVGLLSAGIDRLATILEGIINHLDHFSQMIFHQPSNGKKSKRFNYNKMLKEIGACDDLGTKVRASLVSFVLLISYLLGNATTRFNADLQSKLKTMAQDITALSDHTVFISNKTNFLLDTTLGMVNIEQSNIIKIFSVVAVIFLPPTLIASIYGMNFQFIPELNWRYGYPIAMVLMILSAWLPYYYFKRKKWL